MKLDAVDLAVIGGGPAGAACALAAARAGLSVAVFEPQGAVFDKPCGEGLLPGGVAALAALGLDGLVQRARAFDGLRYVLDGETSLELDLRASGRAIERPDLLAALERELAGQVRVQRVREHAQARQVAAGYEITTPRGARALARVLVAADGAGGRAAPWLRGASRRRRSERLGLRARFACSTALDRVEVHLGRGCEIYLTPLGQRALNLAVLLERAPAPASDSVRGARGLLEWALERHPRALARLGPEITAPSARALDHAPPRTIADGRSFLAGDACGAVDPILGCGVSLALTSGLAAARAARARMDGAEPASIARAYRAMWRRLADRPRRLAQALRVLSAHPYLASIALAIVRRSPLIASTLVGWADAEDPMTRLARASLAESNEERGAEHTASTPHVREA